MAWARIYGASVKCKIHLAAPERNAGTHQKYTGIDDKLDDFHYYTTFIKFGIGRSTYDTSVEIRNGEIDRN